MPTIAPPQGLRARPGTLDDLEELTALFNRADREIVGVDTHDASHYRMFWTRPGFDPAVDTRMVVSAGGALLGAIFTMSNAPHVSQIFLGRVDPEQRGRGIGAYLIRWCADRCSERIPLAPEGARVSMHTWVHTAHSPTEALFRSRGLEVTRHYVKMGMTIPSSPEPPVWPEGIELSPVDRKVHDRAICAASEESFRDHWGYFETPFEERYQTWKHNFDADPLTDQSLWFVAWDGEEIAGFLIGTERCHDDPEMGYLMIMAVRPRWRRRGLGLAFLRHGIHNLRDRGLQKVGLHADASNLTGAVRLYRQVGMEIVHVHDNWELELCDGEELMVTGS